MGVERLRRYTNLAASIHLLSNKKITLLDPSTWTDTNDAYFIAEYRRLKKLQSVLALCFAECAETYHHWRVFSSGVDGACIEFDLAKLSHGFSGDGRVKAGYVNYKTIAELRDMKNNFDIDELPFLKRFAYRDEREYRLVFFDDKTARLSKEYEIDLSAITRITLSPWMDRNLAKSVKHVLKQLDGCNALKIYHSTLVDNEDWKHFVNQIRE